MEKRTVRKWMKLSGRGEAPKKEVFMSMVKGSAKPIKKK